MKKKLKVLLITGIVTDEHDPRVNPMLKYLLEQSGRFEVKITEEFRGATEETVEGYDLLFVNYDGKENVASPYVGWGETAERTLHRFVQNGGGAVIYHSSFIHGNPVLSDEFDRLVGCRFLIEDGFSRKSPKLSGPVDFVPDAHEITKGFPSDMCTQMEDFFVSPRWLPDVPVTVLATVKDALSDYTDPSKIQAHRRAEFANTDFSKLPGINEDCPVAWVHTYGKGRVFTVSIGHGPDTIRLLPFAALVARASEWAATGEVTIPYPDVAGENRRKAWPFFRDMTVKEFAQYTTF